MSVELLTRKRPIRRRKLRYEQVTFEQFCELIIVKFEHVDGAPDLIVEIISPSTAYIDRGKKKKQYARFGVQEYWLIDPNKQTAEFLINHDGNWEPLSITAEGVFH
jgi:Uma2 family endonuclease